MEFCKLLSWWIVGITTCYGDNSIVQTTYGPIQGEITPMTRQFLSIPFAAPPLDSLRFQPPQPHDTWRDVLETKSVPPGCPQKCKSNIPNICPNITKEDCLYLNIFTPLSDDYSSTNYPVLFYIHGGGFQENYGYGIRMNTTHIVNTTNTIYVTINYRLGALGFFYDDTIGINGNFGYLDQLFALEWVYKNIKSFGGNPERIIIDGESAGAMSVSFHLTNTTNKIIKGGIMESCVNGEGPYPTPNHWVKNGNAAKFESSVGCNQTDNNAKLKCMLDVDVDLMVKEQYNSGLRWSPTVKTDLFEDQIVFLFQKGKTLNVPYIIGNNLKELGSCFAGYNDTLSEQKLQQQLTNVLGANNANMVMKYYNVSNICGYEGGNCVNISCEITTDYGVRCVSRNMTASSAMKYPNTGFYDYHFDHGSSFNPQLYTADSCWETPCHTAELWYVFYSPQAMKQQLNVTFQDDEILLANQMNWYWTNFAQSSDPNKKRENDQKLIEWKSYNINDREIILFDVDNEFRMVTNYDKDVCAFWDSLNWSWLNIE